MLNKELLLMKEDSPSTLTFTIEKQADIPEGDVFAIDITYGGKRHRLTIDFGYGPESIALPYSGDYAEVAGVSGSGYITTWYNPAHVIIHDYGGALEVINVQPGDKVVFIY